MPNELKEKSEWENITEEFKRRHGVNKRTAVSISKKKLVNYVGTINYTNYPWDYSTVHEPMLYLQMVFAPEKLDKFFIF